MVYIIMEQEKDQDCLELISRFD